MPLSTFRTVAGLLCLFRWISATFLYNSEHISKGAALSFAMPSSVLGDKELSISPAGFRSRLRFGPLATGIYRGSSLERNLERNPSIDGEEHFEPGQWAIVLIYEAYDAISQKLLDKSKKQGLPFRAIRRLRYALVTPCTERSRNHGVTILLWPTFLHIRSTLWDRIEMNGVMETQRS